MPGYKTVLLVRTPANSLVNLYSTKLLVYLAIYAFISTTVCLAKAQNCTSARDCDRDGKEDGMQCCNGLCTQSSSCVGQICKINEDCATSEVCCSNRCVDNWNCLGEACSFDADCQWDESCCYGSCKENNECVHLTVIVIICSVAFVFFVAMCSCVCRMITSVKQRSPPSGSSSELTSCTTSLNLTGVTSSSTTNLLRGQGLSSDIPHKSLSHVHPTLHTFFASRSDDPLPVCSETTKKEPKGINTAMTCYGSIRETVQP